MSPNYYVYYRVALDQAERARDVVAALQDDVLAQTGVRGRLMHRRDDAATWMEIYEGISDEQAFDASLAAAVERCGFSSVLAAGSQRVTEIFGPL
jgi:quinol monooxygenase YgiN